MDPNKNSLISHSFGNLELQIEEQQQELAEKINEQENKQQPFSNNKHINKEKQISVVQNLKQEKKEQIKQLNSEKQQEQKFNQSQQNTQTKEIKKITQRSNILIGSYPNLKKARIEKRNEFFDQCIQFYEELLKDNEKKIFFELNEQKEEIQNVIEGLDSEQLNFEELDQCLQILDEEEIKLDEIALRLSGEQQKLQNLISKCHENINKNNIILQITEEGLQEEQNNGDIFIQISNSYSSSNKVQYLLPQGISEEYQQSQKEIKNDQNKQIVDIQREIKQMKKEQDLKNSELEQVYQRLHLTFEAKQKQEKFM